MNNELLICFYAYTNTAQIMKQIHHTKLQMTSKSLGNKFNDHYIDNFVYFFELNDETFCKYFEFVVKLHKFRYTCV